MVKKNNSPHETIINSEKQLKSLRAYKQLTGYMVTDGSGSYVDLVRNDLKNIVWVHGQLILCSGKPQFCPWAQVLWYDVKVIPIKSIGDGTTQLRGISKTTAPQIRWTLYGPQHFRRLALIAGSRALPAKQAPWSFPPSATALTRKIGGVTLLDPNTMAVALRTDRPFPLGIPDFIESKSGPPSRAYLKLYEALCLTELWPKPGEHCLEIGAAPGGWTWVLAQLGAHVTTFDRAPLDPRFDREKLIVHHKKDAFTATPDSVANADQIRWIFSDIICYPEKLYQWLTPWLELGKPINFICTLKFQGKDHYEVIQKFAAIPHSRVVHLFHNKHELTWICSPFLSEARYSSSVISDSASKSKSE